MNARDMYAVQMRQLRGDPSRRPDGSIIVPVNAQADLERVWTVINDLLRYQGQHTFEIIVMVNNYPPDDPPMLDAFHQTGLRVVSQPDVRLPGIRVAVTARVHGARVAASSLTIHFDADCRVPDPTALLDWYVEQFAAGARAAYTPVNFCDLHDDAATQARVAIHHLARWFKRRVIGVPTIRGSNFAIDRDLFIELFNAGYLPADFSIGPVLRAMRAPVAYNGSPRLAVLTSGRYFERGWKELARYLIYRLHYNAQMLRVRAGMTNPDDRQANGDRPYRIYRVQVSNAQSQTIKEGQEP
ncbi:MAG: glycosyltransferase family 2 protein [Roseiflexus sp.]|nr:glycosyltransferase family 2 protein [Roseiflexus sp.]MCS7290025.1 glycosyltransferase family 2 protein [Roseiflexus sp.]MDW8146430.1 glycosyltransferase [Roseiflexaceae bacterium]MDW8233575.1 glycosyltransferase [Roseiflexaceae bacterium]